MSDATAPQRASDLLGDDSGSDTFGRYRWQAKMAVLSWLGCLGESDGPLGVVCEGAEDVVLVYATRRVFAQLKTRTKGSWSAANVTQAGGGVDSLAKTFLRVDPGIDDRFELWLEGPAGNATETTQFFALPSAASTEVRRRVKALGLARLVQLNSFLAKLFVVPDRPPRTYVDQVIMQYIAALWPHFGSGECRGLYESLLALAEKAQAGELDPDEDTDSVLQAAGHSSEDDSWARVRTRCLTRERLRRLTPPLPGETREDLLERLEKGEYASALELKMTAAGASEETIRHAQTWRARADSRRYALRALGDSASDRVDLLEERVLNVGNARVALTSLTARTNPAVAARPGESVAMELRGNPGNLAALDSTQFFGDPDMVYGLLCQVSDECRFWWREL